MKVFISWSGDTSKEVASALFSWLPRVIQSIDPYFSSQSIKKGARGLSDIAIELEETNFGIICLTKDNTTAPWINFEAGALSKSLQDGRIAPFLFNMAVSDIPPNSPLIQFQATYSNAQQDVLSLLQSLNSAGEAKLSEDVLKDAFEKWWPSLEQKLKMINIPKATVVEKKADKEEKIFEILDQLLGLARQQNSILKSPTNILPPEYLREILQNFNPATTASVGNSPSNATWAHGNPVGVWAATNPLSALMGVDSGKRAMGVTSIVEPLYTGQKNPLQALGSQAAKKVDEK
ncbi:MAG: TIR domain-containing protein [Alphaproteobacteria bacterium]|nr:MAG: TIR domain-containing protein [Alphaproteobacteria bacterium]